jgi:hypothetical protein
VSDAFTWLAWLDAVNALQDVRPTTVRVAVALRKHAKNADGTCYPGEATLAKEAGACSVRAVQLAVADLRRRGALEVESGKGRKTSRYRLVAVEDWPIGRTDVRPIEEVGRTDVRGSDEQACGAEANGRAGQPRTGVRPELLNGSTEENLLRRTASKHTQQQPPPPSLASYDYELTDCGRTAIESAAADRPFVDVVGGGGAASQPLDGVEELACSLSVEGVVCESVSQDRAEEERAERNAARLERGRLALAEALGVGVLALEGMSVEALLAAFEQRVGAPA